MRVRDRLRLRGIIINIWERLENWDLNGKKNVREREGKRDEQGKELTERDCRRRSMESFRVLD